MKKDENKNDAAKPKSGLTYSESEALKKNMEKARKKAEKDKSKMDFKEI